jgi:S-adenosylmethionine decarboxylase
MNKPVPMHSVKPNPFGAHIRMMTDITMIRALLYRLPEDMGMHRIREPVIVSVGPNCHKDPGGLSGFVMIAESHISFHTFPARGFVTMDLYTCQNAIDRNATVAYLKAAFELTDADVYIQDRGIRYPALDLALENDALKSN